jgi:hypothetical protein
VLELVSTLRHADGLTVVSAMHDLTLAGQYADRLLLLDAGKPVLSGPPAEVLTEEIVARHYGASVRVVAEGVAGLAVVPLRRFALRLRLLRILGENGRPERENARGTGREDYGAYASHLRLLGCVGECGKRFPRAKVDSARASECDRHCYAL